MINYDYTKDIESSCTLLSDLEGAVLEAVLINVVDPEFNVVYLQTTQGIFALQGEVGGEYLGVHRLDAMPEVTNQESYIVCKYEPFEKFVGNSISQARQIGTAWHGHGFEFTFNGCTNKSMIVQSIYCGSKPEQLEDCLRLGVGLYENEWAKT